MLDKISVLDPISPILPSFQIRIIVFRVALISPHRISRTLRFYRIFYYILSSGIFRWYSSSSSNVMRMWHTFWSHAVSRSGNVGLEAHYNAIFNSFSGVSALFAEERIDAIVFQRLNNDDLIKIGVSTLGVSHFSTFSPKFTSSPQWQAIARESLPLLRGLMLMCGKPFNRTLWSGVQMHALSSS